MEAHSQERRPLAEVQNVPPKPPAAAPLKPMLSRTNSMATKPTVRRTERASALPQPPTSRRHTQSGIPSKKSVPALPSRVGAKPKRGGPPHLHMQTGTALHDRAAASMDMTSRRATASMSFTAGNSLRRTDGRRALGAMGAKEKDNLLMELGSKTDSLMKKMDSMTDKDSRNASKTMREEFRVVVEDIRNQIQSSQNERDTKLLNLVEESFELKTKLMEASNNETRCELLLEQERMKRNVLQKEIDDMRLIVQALENEKTQYENVEYVAQGTVDTLEKSLKEAEAVQEGLQVEKQQLQGVIAEMKRSQETLEIEANTFASKMKELQRRLEVAEMELTSVESEVRRVRREKDHAIEERDELEQVIKKRNSQLQEERKKLEELSTRTKSLDTARLEQGKLAEEQLNFVRSEASERVKELENRLDEAQSATSRYFSELENRKQEVTHMKEALVLQESNMSRYNYEKISLGAKIEALCGELTDKNRELSRLFEENKAHLQVICTLEGQAREDAAMRRKLHNAIQELKGNIRVFCRVRPLLEKELASSSTLAAQHMFEYNEKGQGLVAKPQQGEGKSVVMSYPFKFDRVFRPQCDQATVFEEISQLVQSALDGYRVCIFAYGQTGSGKTHTMLGRRGDGGVELGMIPRSVRQVFETAKQLEKDQWSFRLKASFLEIYNEQVRDLLVDNGSPVEARAKNDMQTYKIVFNSETKLSSVADLTVEDVESEEQVQRLVNKSMKNRATAATKANERSSRSHSVFRLYIEGKNAATGQKLNGLLNLVDLAGSERLSQSKAEGDRLRETRNINKSLSALGDVIAALANREKHIPFRNSKLTHLLQDSLGGDCKTLMFVNVSHALESFNESLCSLRFASKVNSCHVGTAKRSARIEL